MARALVLVGHGSAKNKNTRRPLDRIVDEIKSRNLFDEVCCGFLKEDQRICKTLVPLESDEIIVVPFFISDGYYTRNVIPKCLAKNKVSENTSVRYTSSVGSHPMFSDLLLSHAQAAGWKSGDTLVVLGHGTPKNPLSGVNVYLQSQRLRRLLPREEIITTFLDEPPFVTDTWNLCEANRIFIIPLFIGDGWHVTETIPEDLGLKEGQAVKGPRTMIMTSAVGTDSGLVEVVLKLSEVMKF